MKEPLSCLRCGKCCFVDLTAYAEKEDFDRWRAENRQDILEMIEHRHLIWAGDRMVSSEQAIIRVNVLSFTIQAIRGFARYDTRPWFAVSIIRVRRNYVRNGR